MEPWRLLSQLCTPGLCVVDAPAAIPESALATQPATTQSAPKAVAAQQNLNMQLKPQEDSQQVAGETVYTCKLQVYSQPLGAATRVFSSKISQKEHEEQAHCISSANSLISR